MPAAAWVLIPLLSGVVAWLVVAFWQRRHHGIRERLARAEADVRRLEGTDAARIRFLGNIAHELRTPLTLVLGQLDAASVEADEDARAHQLRVVGRNARRIKRLADQALELARLDAGALEPRRQDVEIVPFLESLVMSFEELAERKGILLEFFGRPRSIRCRLDPEQLTTIVSNLLSNALKYTPAGGRVGVVAEARGAVTSADAPGTLRITVVDTGAGIAPERHAQIFERFVRGPDDDRLHTGGAGIGLALARELARIHGGTISVESELGRGARFIVELPLGHPGPPATTPPLLAGDGRPEITAEILYRTTGDPDAPGAPTPDLPRILVVDDSADLREWIAAQLAEVGSAVQAADGVAALDLARESVPDLVVTDVRMGRMDGVELCRRLRADERTSHIPIVMLTVRSAVEQRVEGIDAGADEYLTKPLDARELKARVSGLLATRQRLRERFREQVVVKPSDVSARSVDQTFFEKVVRTIDEEIGNPDFSVPQLADAMAMSPSQLGRKIRALINQSPGQLIRSLRLQRAADLIVANAGNIAEIGYRVGFNDQSHFSRTFKRHFGKAPAEYRREAASEST